MRMILVAFLLLLGATPAAAAPAPLGGGSVLTSASYRCTAAFAATRGTTGLLVTGPCATIGTQLYSNSVLVGPVAATSANGAVTDVTVSNTTAWTLVPWITVGSTQYVISGSTETAIGGSVCLLDSSLGQQCGVITAKNLTVTFAQGTITGLTRTNICMSTSSSIAFVSGGQAQGIPIGGSSCVTTGVSTSCRSTRCCPPTVSRWSRADPYAHLPVGMRRNAWLCQNVLNCHNQGAH